MTALLLLGTVLAPLGMLAACLHAPIRRRMPMLLAFAPLPGIAAALFADPGAALVLDAERLRFTFALDRPSALLLGCASLLWSVAGGYASVYLGRKPGAVGFAVWWLVTLAGSLWVFLANDLASFYLAFAMVSLAAFGLVVHDGTERARRAGAVYLFLTVLGEVCLLLGFALLAAAAPGDSLALADVLPALPEARARPLIVVLLLAGFGLKAGMVPLHVWLPLAHPAAPMPASAVLSGAIIKAGIIGLIRFLPVDGGVADWGGAIVGLGFVTAFWGVAVGVTQANPKTVLAYSSISQMGVVVAALGMGLAAGAAAAPLHAAFYASHHVLAKGALFLAVGVAAVSGGRARWLVLGPALVLALGFGGLPFTGGAAAKAAVKDQLDVGVVAVFATVSAIGSTVLMLHFVRCLAATMPADPALRSPMGLLLPWLGLAMAAVVLPWVLFVGDRSEALAPGALWAGLWPVLLGVVLAEALRRARLPRIPEGDVLLLAERGLRAGAPWGERPARLEAALRAWPAAGLALLGLVVAFGTTMFLAAR